MHSIETQFMILGMAIRDRERAQVAWHEANEKLQAELATVKKRSLNQERKIARLRKKLSKMNSG